MKQRIIILDKPGKKKLRVSFRKEGEEVEVLGLVLARRRGDYELDVLVDHKVGKTFGRVMIRGIAKNGARVKVKGQIRIEKVAQGVDDFLEMRLLMLDGQSQVQALPELNIEANEVKASHAATVGRLDEEQLFYLMTRGMEKQEAEALIVKGFLDEVRERMGG